jgi:sugar O-acyltransferase (sialic acid O-acetyltransferase NeuD family)
MAKAGKVDSQRTAKNLVILGAGGFAREVAWLVSEINCADPGAWNVVGFWDREPAGAPRTLNGFPVLSRGDVDRFLPDLFAVAAIGHPSVKRRAVTEAAAAGCRFATLVHPDVRYDAATVEIGAGSILCAGNIITVNVKIGSHVILNLDCTVGHDSVFGDFSTISPGCHLSGYSTIGEGAFLGTGAALIERRSVGEDAIIGAGAVVTSNIPPNVTAVGVPAMVKRR